MDITQEFYIRQIKTTKKIIETFTNTNEFSPTMLINSLLSLVILPFERAKKNNGKRIFGGKYQQEIVEKLGISPDIFEPIKSCDGEKPAFRNKSIYSFVNKFRNGIAHQNLDVHVNADRVIHITIYNKYYCNQCKTCKKKSCKEKKISYSNNGVIDFQITVTVKELQKLALYIADSYLEAIG